MAESMQEISAGQILSRLPARLQDARQRQGLSLDAVAKLSGVSRAMVSQIERGESSPTVVTLWNLTRALQVAFAGLLDAAGRLQVYDIRFEAGGLLFSDPHGAGTREQVTVLEGTITLRAGADACGLRPNDTARYRADQPH